MFRIVLFVIALTAGGGAAWLVLAMQPPEAPVAATAEPAPPVAAEEVLVAAGNLAQGHALTYADLEWQAWPDDAGRRGFITRSGKEDAAESLKGSIVRSHFVAGEPIREEKLVKADSGFLSAILPSGRRAVAVRVTAENTAGGFILPNDRVDVLHTVTLSGESNGNSRAVTRTILTNVRVLAIDQKADDSSAEAAAIGRTATLELAPEQTEAVAAAEAAGLLSLALRSIADANEKPAEVPKAKTVRIIRNGRAEIVNVN
jgi:pilus assembly protein CpaB